MDFSEIDNIIFDLGGVIINLDYERMYNNFAQRTGKDVQAILNDFKARSIFEKFEVNDISDRELRSLIRENFQTDISDSDIDSIWNSLLRDIPRERIELLKKLKQDYNLYLLSNTNNIHIPAVNRILEETTGVDDLQDLFEKVYYSHKIKMRKPDMQIYDYVSEDLKLDRSRTLFIDDLEINTEAAKEAGWKTIHLTKGNTITNVFS